MARQLAGGLLLFAGLSVMWLGAWALFYGVGPTPADGSCGAFCTLVQLAMAALGPVAGQVVVGSLTFLVGLGATLGGRLLYGAN